MRKAHSVVRNIRVFSDLHSERSITVNLSPVSAEFFVRSLIATCADNQFLLGGDSRVGARVDTESFAPLADWEIDVDRDLIDQCFHNIVENAFKYSQPFTVIRVSGGRAGKWFCVSFINQGIKLTEADAKKCTERGWRGEIAESVTPSGSGIGLWLVDNIMTALKGRLEIVPTTEDVRRETQMKLWLPLSRPSRKAGISQ
jgi:signal transduction histidine kinase